MKVLKCGGSTLASVDAGKRVVEIVRAGHKAPGDIVVVVSALYGVTNQLLEMVESAESGRLASSRTIIKNLRTQHQRMITGLVSKSKRSGLLKKITSSLDTLYEICESVARVHECSPRVRDRVVGHGELYASWLVAAALPTSCKAVAVDARELIVTDDHYGNAHVLTKLTRENIAQVRASWRGRVPVVTGFIAATADGIPTTVGRNGTDYTASLLGAELKAKTIEVWKDVDGVLSADPRVVDEAFTLPELSYAEAMELAYFGAKVLDPRAVIPAIDAKIPLHIRSIYAPENAGTRISSKTQPGVDAVKGITSVDDVSLITLEGAGMIGVSGVAARMFTALATEGINVIAISQASSEQNICCVVPRDRSTDACDALRSEFAEERRYHQIRRIHSADDVCVVAIVGTAMRGTPGIAARLFDALGKNKINVIAAAQGSSEQNISLVLKECERIKALNTIHGTFHLARQHVNVMVIGKGTVGSCLLKQIADGQARLESTHDLRLRVVGVADSKRMLVCPDGVNLSQWKRRLSQAKAPADLKSLGSQLVDTKLENLIIVDATAHEAVAKQYPEWLRAGFSVVTPNKKACTMPLAFYDKLQTELRNRNAHFLYETCVGAGLPVISTLQDLIDSGDDIIQIDGLLSGTLGYIFSELETGARFSEIIQTAHSLGYTEPDPRDDLSGMDVARKALILARKTGARMTLKQVGVEALVPKSMMRGSVDNFMRACQTLDEQYARDADRAQKQGKVLRYLASYAKGKAKVGLQAVPKDSPFGQLQGADNMVVFTTRRYRDNPLIVRGPGAGPAVTSGGVFADILKVAHLLTT